VRTSKNFWFGFIRKDGTFEFLLAPLFEEQKCLAGNRMKKREKQEKLEEIWGELP